MQRANVLDQSTTHAQCSRVWWLRPPCPPNNVNLLVKLCNEIAILLPMYFLERFISADSLTEVFITIVCTVCSLSCFMSLSSQLSLLQQRFQLDILPAGLHEILVVLQPGLHEIWAILPPGLLRAAMSSLTAVAAALLASVAAALRTAVTALLARLTAVLRCAAVLVVLVVVVVLRAAVIALAASLGCGSAIPSCFN